MAIIFLISQQTIDSSLTAHTLKLHRDSSFTPPESQKNAQWDECILIGEFETRLVEQISYNVNEPVACRLGRSTDILYCGMYTGCLRTESLAGHLGLDKSGTNTRVKI